MSQNWESQWFKHALSDPACYHGTLFLSAAHKALLTGTEKSLPLEVFQHKGEAIRIVNERLTDLKSGLEDGTIAAIACLAAFEVRPNSSTYFYYCSLLPAESNIVNRRWVVHIMKRPYISTAWRSWWEWEVDLDNLEWVASSSNFSTGKLLWRCFDDTFSHILFRYCYEHYP